MTNTETISTARPVAAFADAYPLARGRVELGWAGSDYSTGVIVSDPRARVLTVERDGKGDALIVDLNAARAGMVPVMRRGSVDAVAWLGMSPKLHDEVEVATPEQYESFRTGRGVIGYTMYPDLPTA